MQLSDAEKLILLMLCEIHEQLPIKNGIDAAFVKSAIYSDNTWGLKWHFSGIFDNTEDTPPEVDEVCNILDMWDFIEASYERLSEEEKATVLKQAPLYGSAPKFMGFDGNSDARQMSIASFLIDDLGRFQRFKGRDLNSHMPESLNGFRRMVAVFLSLLRPVLMRRLFSATEIISMLNEKVHPENRKDQALTSKP
jgi:uncharacterized protein